MPRLRNTLIIQGHSIRPSTIIEFQDRSGTGRQTMYMKVYNIDQTHIYYAKKPATGTYNYGPTTSQTIANFKNALESISRFYYMRLVDAQA